MSSALVAKKARRPSQAQQEGAFVELSSLTHCLLTQATSDESSTLAATCFYLTKRFVLRR